MINFPCDDKPGNLPDECHHSDEGRRRREIPAHLWKAPPLPVTLRARCSSSKSQHRERAPGYEIRCCYPEGIALAPFPNIYVDRILEYDIP